MSRSQDLRDNQRLLAEAAEARLPSPLQASKERRSNSALLSGYAFSLTENGEIFHLKPRESIIRNRLTSKLCNHCVAIDRNYL
mmetsp:Transcript_2974/g.8233  ORF Transcript_2974/g.8233 Transcript_2974/m.8233 type:complete len:83 (+) Transcript_2974:279-527(+)